MERLEEHSTKRLELVRQTVDDVLPEEAATNAPRRARQDAPAAPQDSDATGGSSSSTTGNDVEMRPTAGCKRPLEPSGDEDMVCGLEVCDELNEGNANGDSKTK